MIGNLDDEAASGMGHGDLGGHARAGVPHGVGEGLLDDPVGGQFQALGSRRSYQSRLAVRCARLLEAATSLGRSARPAVAQAPGRPAG